MTAQKSIFIALDGSSNGTTPKGARLALGGLIEHDGSADPLGVKLGVLEDTFTPVVSGKANMSYDIRAAVFVTNPTGSAANGPTVGANDAVVNVATTAAPGSNARYDVVWVRQHVVAADGGADVDNILEFGVEQGDVAASPSVPDVPTGALALANVLVTSGTLATNSLTFTQAHDWVRTRAGSGGSLRESLVFTSSGTFNKADYPWLKTVRVRGIAGGGGGGGSVATTVGEVSVGAGGAAGESGEVVLGVEELLASETVTRGAGGTGGAGGAGGAGGTTSFGAHLVLNGGSGGGAMGAGSSVAFSAGGVGVGGGTGDFTVRGACGGHATRGGASTLVAGSGGTGPFGGNGRGEAAFTAGGSNGTAAEANSGAGGSGGYRIGTGGATTGGAGGSGIVIVELFG